MIKTFRVLYFYTILYSILILNITSSTSISRSVTLTFNYSHFQDFTVTGRYMPTSWTLPRRQLLSRFYRNRNQKWRLLQQVIFSTTVYQAIISSIPASSMIFAIEAGMPASVMITSTRSRLHIRPKPLLPNFDESARMMVLNEASIIRLFN